MADIRIKDLATTASTTASDDFMAVDGTTNGTRKLSAATPSFATSVTVPGVSGPTATNLTLAGGSTGASLVLGQGATADVTIAPTGSTSAVLVGTGVNTAKLYTRGTTSLAFGQDQSGVKVEWARLTNSTGNLLIGTTTDTSSRLKIVGTDSSGPKTWTASSAALSGALFDSYQDSGGNGFQRYTDIVSLQDSDGVNGGGVIRFVTNSVSSDSGVEAMRVTKAQNLLIGGTTDITGSGGLKVYGTTAASSTTTGALQVAGGVGVAGAGYFGGAVTGKLITTQADDTSSGFVVKRSVNPYIDFYDGGTSGTIRAEISATNDGVSGGTLVLAPRNAAGTITTAVTITKDLAATFAGAVLHPDGTAAAPSIAFSADTGTGLYRQNTNVIGVALAGAAAGRFEGDGASGIRFRHPTGNYLGLNNSGAIEVIAAGTNRNITLTPSGTGSVTVSSSTASTNTTSGALVVTGGVGVGGALNVGSFSSITGGASIQNTVAGFRYLMYATGTANNGANAGRRYNVGVSTTAESGSNVGSDYEIRAYDDSGTSLRGGPDLLMTRSTGAATFAGAVAIGNTVNTVSPTSPNRTVTMVIGGVTYYLAAKTTND